MPYIIHVVGYSFAELSSGDTMLAFALTSFWMPFYSGVFATCLAAVSAVFAIFCSCSLASGVGDRSVTSWFATAADPAISAPDTPPVKKLVNADLSKWFFTLVQSVSMGGGSIYGRTTWQLHAGI